MNIKVIEVTKIMKNTTCESHYGNPIYVQIKKNFHQFLRFPNTCSMRILPNFTDLSNILLSLNLR